MVRKEKAPANGGLTGRTCQGTEVWPKHGRNQELRADRASPAVLICTELRRAFMQSIEAISNLKHGCFSGTVPAEARLQ